MDVISNSIDANKFLFFTINSSGHVFVQFNFPAWGDEVLSTLHYKDQVCIKLGVGVGHFLFQFEVVKVVIIEK